MKRKLLILTPRFPYPPVGGDRLRIYQICRHLAREFDLTLLSLCASAEEAREPVPDDGVFARVERVRHGAAARLAGLARALPTRLPMQTGYYLNRAFARRVRELAPQHDAVLAHLVRMAEYLLPLPMPRIVEMTDAISLNYRRAAMRFGGLKRLAYEAEARRLTAYERHVARRCDLAVLVSHVDREALALGGDEGRVLLCSNGVDTAALPYEYAPGGRTVIFIGKNTTAPNMDAILHFAVDLLPLARARVPDLRFRVVGEIEPGFAARLRAMGVETTGRVSSVSAASRGALAGVCPLRFGAGVQNKLLEYMALGIPAVTSPIGLEGLDAQPGRHLLVADSAQEWAEALARLAATPQMGREMAEAARRFVVERHSWEAHLEPLSAAVRELIEKHRRGAKNM